MEQSNISWTDGTWNPWYGCDKVGGQGSECQNCYIDRTLVRRGLPPWGQVYKASESTWNLPYRMEAKAKADGKRYKLFTCSLSDFFHHKADQWRSEAWAIIKACPHGDFLILTKRPLRIPEQLPADWGSGYPNVWLGVSVGLMRSAHRIDELRKIPAAVRFLSCEPLLESLADIDLTGIDWVIAGGESGSNFRPMRPLWAAELRDKCQAAGVAFWFKQGAASRPGTAVDLLGKVYHQFPKKKG